MAEQPSRQLRSIFHDPDYYAKSFRAYSNLSSRLHVLKSWIENIFPMKVVETLSANTASGSSSATLRMLGVGSGTGEADCDMISQLLPIFPKISNTVLEPAPEHIETYKRLVASRSFAGIAWDWRQQTLDEYNNDSAQTDREKFHFISTIHSLYYVDDAEKAVMNMYDMLQDGGVMMIIVLADDGGFGRLWRHFPMFSDDLQSHILSDTVKDILTTNGIKYDLVKQPSRVDVSCCFEEGNPDGVLVSDFLAHVINVRENAPANWWGSFMSI
ncbi:putative histamine N-methyltransferase A [Apostichopus japonicus]|uniref:Putative histamine N-methyltransferase A n=1 Tax=Stichopus japonicus TaxID=307972 RepID=A0A2G8JRM9_STIJA|nr:putative histamine N-methyltransferase A [Apostichopus japonicus]